MKVKERIVNEEPALETVIKDCFTHIYNNDIDSIEYQIGEVEGYRVKIVIDKSDSKLTGCLNSDNLVYTLVTD